MYILTQLQLQTLSRTNCETTITTFEFFHAVRANCSKTKYINYKHNIKFDKV